MTNRNALVVIGSMVIIIFWASPVFGISAVSPDDGAYVYDQTYHTRLNVSDVQCDGNAAYGNWNRSTADSRRLENRSGCDSTVFRGNLGIVSLRACTDITWNPDPCSAWKD